MGRIRSLTPHEPRRTDGLAGVARRLRHDELGELVAEQLATAGAIILGRRRHESWAEAWPSQSCAPDTRLSRGRRRRRSTRWRVAQRALISGSAGGPRSATRQAGQSQSSATRTTRSQLGASGAG